MEERSQSTLPHILVAAGVIGLGCLSVWQTLEIPRSVMYATVGPQVFPWIISVMILGLGLLLMLAALRGGWAHDQDGTLTERLSLGYVYAGLIVNVALIDIAGFILASTAMFVLVARAFGSPLLVRDAIIGFSLAFVAYIGFDRVLGYKIGTGLIENLL